MADLGNYSISSQVRPVDTYARPQARTPKRSALDSLLSSIADNEAKIIGGMNKIHEGRIEKDVQEARHARLKNQLSYAEAVRLYEETNGEQGISGGHSPYWIKEYKRMDGQLRARNEYSQWLNEEYMTSGLADIQYGSSLEAAAAYSSFVDRARIRFLEAKGDTADESWLEGFETERGNIEQSMSTSNLNQRAAANEAMFEDLYVQQLNDVFDSGRTPQEIADDINIDKLNKINNTGISARRINQIVAESARNQALWLAENGDFVGADNVLEVLNHVKTGTGTLSRTKVVGDLMADTKRRLLDVQRKMEDYEYTKQTRAQRAEDRPYEVAARDHQAFLREKSLKDLSDKEFAENELASAFTAILADPLKDHTDLFNKFANDTRLASFTERVVAFSNGREVASEDPMYVFELEKGVYEGTLGVFEISKSLTDGLIGKNTASRLLQKHVDRMQQSETIRGLPDKYRSVYTRHNKALDEAIRMKSKDPVFGVTHEGVLQAMEMNGSYHRMFMEWASSNPNASELEAGEYARKLVKHLVGEVADPMMDGDEVINLNPKPSTTPTEPKSPPQEAIRMLRENPETAPLFDAKFGEGASSKYTPKLNLETINVLPKPEDSMRPPSGPLGSPDSGFTAIEELVTEVPFLSDTLGAATDEEKQLVLQYLIQIYQTARREGYSPEHIKASLSNYFSNIDTSGNDIDINEVVELFNEQNQ